MPSVPVWVWTSSAMFAGAGVHLWWRPVARTTRPGIAVRRIGAVVARLVMVAAPVALLGQFLAPMGFQRVSAGRRGSATASSSSPAARHC